MDPLGVLVILLFLICYFSIGLKGARRFVDNSKMGAALQAPQKRGLRYILIAVFSVLFAVIGFAQLVVLLVLKIIRMFF